MLRAVANGAVELMYNNATKLTTGTGDLAFTIGNTSTDTTVNMSRASGGAATYQVMGLNTIFTLGSTSGSTTSATHIRGGSSTTGSGLTVLASGNVGIGDTTPTAILDVAGIGWINPADGSHSGWNFRQADTFKGWVGYNDSTDVVNLSMDGSITAGINVNSSGRVGIGTNDPQAMLEVHGPIVFGDVHTDNASAISDSYNNVTALGAGDIILNTGVGLSNDGATCTITWAKESWASINYDIEYSVASAAGRVAGGGYHNGSGGTISGHQEAVLYGSDYLTIGGSGQTLIFTITFPGSHHPHVRARFSSSGGAGSPNAGDFTVAWTNT
jgi:hypothetical protein